MKTTLILLAVAGTVAPVLAEKVMPEPFPADRYGAMKSPFGLATPVAAPVVADKSFADGWYLAGVSQPDGKNLVHVRSRDQSVSFQLHGDERNDNGVKLQNVEWSPAWGKTTATIEKDGQFAKIELLNQTEMVAPGPAPGMNPAAPPRPPSATNFGGKAPVPTYPQPGAAQPRNVIPRPSGQPVQPGQPGQPSYQITPGLQPKPAVQPPNANQAPAAAPSTEGRRRIRMIPTQPSQ